MGRQETGLDVIKWSKIATDKGAGEILLTSVDMEGTKKGFDFDLIKEVSNKVNVPIIVSGGFGKPEDMLRAVRLLSGCDCTADAFHFNRVNIKDLRKIAIKNNLQIRKL